MTHKPRKKSIMQKLLVPMTAVMLLQGALFLGAVFFGGTLEQLDTNAADILNERTNGRKNYIQNEMLHRWGTLNDNSAAINQKIQNTLSLEQKHSEELRVGNPFSASVLEAISGELIYLLRKNSVTDVFLIFSNGTEAKPADGEYTSRAGIHLRDSDPTSTPSDRSDIVIMRGSPTLTKSLGLAMDTAWAPVFDLTKDNAAFFSPVMAAQQYPELAEEDLGYWSPPFCTNEGDDTALLTYSIPLRDADGRPYAVLGIGVTDQYLRRFLPSEELAPDNKGVYVLAVGTASEETCSASFQTAISNGPLYSRLFGENGTICLKENPRYSSFWDVNSSNAAHDEICASVQPLTLYNTNTPFEREQWALIGAEEGNFLFAFSRSTYPRLFGSLGIALGLGIFCLLLVGRLLTRPISALAKKVRESDPQKPVALLQIGISEIDELSTAVEHLSRNVADSSSKLSKIISLSGMQLGAFEYETATQTAFCTEGFFHLLDPEWPVEESLRLSLAEFTRRMGLLENSTDMEQESPQTKIYRLLDADGTSRWIRMHLVENGSNTLGVMANATNEMVEKRKIEYERDYDLLTNLLNRRSFQRLARERLAHPEERKYSLLLMMDLDNLKFVNDTYGHDCGDQYLRRAADLLRGFSGPNGLAARVSGDEFYLLLSGFVSPALLDVQIDALRGNLHSALMALPDGKIFRVRASAGIARCPEDSTHFDELVKFADFAMYDAKHSDKGTIHYFNRDSYFRDSILLHGREELNRLIDGKLVRYAFQPIVEAATGQIYGYEALMRPQLENLRSPEDVLRLARAQSKLYDIEKITWFIAARSFFSFGGAAEGRRLFINSIANQQLSEQDMAAFDREFAGKQTQMVIELTEEEKYSPEYTLSKQQHCREHGALTALDDYGTGYNGDAALLFLSPDFVKIDVTFVRGIDKDENRRLLLENMTVYLRERKIRIIAEGVETQEEMELLLKVGVGYFQGYFFGKPDFALNAPLPGALAALRDAQERLNGG